MTLPELQKLSDDELRIKVAEAQGWTDFFRSPTVLYGTAPNNHKDWPKSHDVVPDYLSLDVAWGLIPVSKIRKFKMVPWDFGDTPREAARSICIAYLLPGSNP